MEGFEEYKNSDGVATREFKTLRNEIKRKNIIINEQSEDNKNLSDEVERLKKMIDNGLGWEDLENDFKPF